MIQKPPLIKLRNLKDLQCSQKLKAECEELATTPTKAKKPRRRAATTATKTKKVALDLKAPPEDKSPVPPAGANPDVAPPPPVSTVKRATGKSVRKEPPPNQLRINAFFKTCEKTYKIEPVKEEPTPLRKSATEIKKSITTSTTKKNSRATKSSHTKMGGRKRLFVDDDDDIDEGSSAISEKRATTSQSRLNNECVNLISDSEEEETEGDQLKSVKTEKESPAMKTLLLDNGCKGEMLKGKSDDDCKTNAQSNISSIGGPPHGAASSSKTMPLSSASPETSRPVAPALSSPKTKSHQKSKTPATTRRKPKPCPPYKIIEGTTFAVDAFQYGTIEGVTEYFLTHFHADHYIGLTKKFAMPLYMSTITARFVRTFIPVEEQYIHELELNSPIVVNNIEITALDANHCPGAIMLFFKFLNTGKCVLHTGDFRAWHGMEEEPIFWNNDVTTIYLDTTYLSEKYAFCTQYESIDRAKSLTSDFRAKHKDKRILYVCGSYVIGKEKFWSSLAEEFELKVWTEDNRSKALKAMEDKHLNKLLIDNPLNADMHVIALGKLSYLNLVDYFSMYQHRYDIMLAIRPSGWEKDTRPQYRGKINIIGVEYSEHSSYAEMKRFVKFLKPENVISTVPLGRDLMKTPNVPEKWYKYEKLQVSSNYQPRIDQFLGKSTTLRKAIIRMPNANKGGLEIFVSPLSKKHTKADKEIDNNNNTNSNDLDKDTIVSISTSANEFDPPLILNHNQRIKSEMKTNKENALTLSSQLKIKVEKREKCSPKLKSSNKISQKKQVSENTTDTILSQKKQASQNTKDTILSQKKKVSENAKDTILSQSLKEGESCSIFITNSSSSDYFEKAMPKNGCRRRITSSSSDEEMPTSQKHNKRVDGERKAYMPSMPTTKEVEEDECNGKVLNENYNHAYERDDEPTTSKKAAEMLKAQKQNPLLKSTTTSHESSSSSTNEEVPTSQTSQDLRSSGRSLRNKTITNDIIPASQNTQDLANTPRPLRNKSKISQYLDIIPASQTSKDLERTPRPIRNKFISRNNLQNDELIPASQTTADLACTPRPIRQKRLHSTPMTATLDASPPKKTSSPSSVSLSPLHDNSNDENGDVAAEAGFNQSQLLTQIIKGNRTIDLYDTSQLINIVKDALADQKLDTSTDHMPAELLSDFDPDADDDWID